MNIQTFNNPFCHVIIYNFLNKNLLHILKQYSKFLNFYLKKSTYNDYLDPYSLGSAFKNNESLAKRNSIFLHEIFTNPISSVIFAEEMFIEFNKIFKLKDTDSYFLYNVYKNSDYYKPHTDDSLYTCIYYTINEKVKFQGGCLKFNEHNYSFKPISNSLIIFPGKVSHEVTTLKADNHDDKDKILRTSITMFVKYKDTVLKYT
jgi:Rps23 Pro-64 3,4-dihydroxylase Tpa1-like proline 4-hydroxylase